MINKNSYELEDKVVLLIGASGLLGQEYSKSLSAADMLQEEGDPPSLEIGTGKTFSILFFTDKDEVIKFQSELTNALDTFDE